MDICDKCGQKLIQRTDDTPQVVRNRITTYHQQTAPLVNGYQEKEILHNINGNQDIENVTRDLCRTVDGLEG